MPTGQPPSPAPDNVCQTPEYPVAYIPSNQHMPTLARVCASGDHTASGESRGTARPPHGGMFAPLVYYQLRLDVKRMPFTLSTSDEQTRKAQGMAHSPSLTKYGIGPVPNATGSMSADG